MNDLKPFNHGEEGTHSVCNKHNIGGKSVCCECAGKTDCSNMTPLQKEIVETAERIVIDYANLSGRESEHRAEFREKVISHLCQSFIRFAHSVIEQRTSKLEQLRCDEMVEKSKEEARREELKNIILAYQSNELEGKGFDFYFAIRTRLDELTTLTTPQGNKI